VFPLCCSLSPPDPYFLPFLPSSPQSTSPLSSLKVLVSDLVEYCANNAHRVALQSAEGIFEEDKSSPLLEVKYNEVKIVFEEVVRKIAIDQMLKMAQSDPNFQKRMAALYFFTEFFKAVHNFNSFVPPTETRDPFVSSSVVPLADYEQEKRERTIKVRRREEEGGRGCQVFLAPFGDSLCSSSRSSYPLRKSLTLTLLPTCRFSQVG